MAKILTVDEYVAVSVRRWPRLFASTSYELSKFKVLDHIFNVLGNGLTLEHFLREALSEGERASVEPFFRCQTLLHGFKEMKDGWPRGYPSEVIAEEDKGKYPEIVFWVEQKTHNIEVPYPHFEREGSMVWGSGDVKFEQLGEEWRRGADWYYARCQAFFEDEERVKHYYFAFPGERDDVIMEGWKSVLKQKGELVLRYVEEYGRVPMGKKDWEAFCCFAWEKQRQEILAFIHETRMMLQVQLF